MVKELIEREDVKSVVYINDGETKRNEIVIEYRTTIDVLIFLSALGRLRIVEVK